MHEMSSFTFLNMLDHQSRCVSYSHQKSESKAIDPPLMLKAYNAIHKAYRSCDLFVI